VQNVIHNEEDLERTNNQVPKSQAEQVGMSHQTYLFKEEFKLIMQLLFILSEYMLKNA